MSRKTPILLRPGPLSGAVFALYRYRRKTLANGREVIDCGSDGRSDVTGDFDALCLETLMGADAPNIVGILDGAADGEALDDGERAEVRAFRERLRAMVERHNARCDARPGPTKRNHA